MKAINDTIYRLRIAEQRVCEETEWQHRICRDLQIDTAQLGALVAANKIANPFLNRAVKRYRESMIKRSRV